MGSSFSLLTVRGIDIRMHITFPLILVWAAIQFGYVAGAGTVGAIFGVIVVSLLFAIVTLHELGHSFAAQYYGVPVERIVLLPLGGVAQLRNIPENPWQEFVIAIAGPAVNFVLAAVLYPIALLFDLDIRGALGALDNLQAITFEAVFGYVFIYNLFLAIFNLIPAFPMDGGRILRAGLASQLPYARATAIAVTIGRSFAWLLGLWGFLGGGFIMILIAFFIYTGAGQEGQMVQLRSILRGFTVEQAYSHPVQILAADDPLQRAVELTLSSFQTSFPVVENGRLVGILTYAGLVRALEQNKRDTAVREAMVTEMRPVPISLGLYEAQQQLRESEADALPVTDERGQFLGLITSRDISEVYSLLSAEPELLARAR